MEPECVVLDEPTTMLDPEGRAEVLATVATLCRERGMTVVLITHALEELVDADRIVVMDGGRIALEGPVGWVFDRLAASRIGRLEPPPAVRLAHSLRADGLPIPQGTYTIEALAEAIAAAAGSARRG
jgi:energy-coupling factor transporter ATP-binding protein EcfA2